MMIERACYVKDRTSISSNGSECLLLGDDSGIAMARVEETGSVANVSSDLDELNVSTK